MNNDHPQPAITRFACWLLILISLASMTGRIGGVLSRERTPMLSANDRSRWCTVRSLVDHGTYAIDKAVFEDEERTKRDPKWQTIDMVRHRGSDGKEHYYSSKPPLYPTMLAGGYWALKHGLGLEMEEDYSAIIRTLLLVVHVLPMALYFVLILQLAGRYCQSDWGRVFVVACATWGTFLSTFAVVLNNHLPAAVSTLVAVYATFQILSRDGGIGWYVLAGLAASFAAANELPALSLVVALAAGLLWKSPLRSIGYLVAVALVAAAFFGTTYLAHGGWKPPYAHREDGEVLATVSLDEPLDEGPVPAALSQQMAELQITLSEQAEVQDAVGDNRWQLWDPADEMRWALVVDGSECRVRRWDDWYEYPRSHWRGRELKGVDAGEPSRGTYALHVLIGHHGIFSLTPIWLLSLAGLAMMLRGSDGVLRGFAALTLTLSAVCIAFYIARPEDDRNYGGVTSGLRWLFWLIPLWLVSLMPVADWLASRPNLRKVAVVLLIISVASAAYAVAKPFSHPWMYDFFLYQEWIVE